MPYGTVPTHNCSRTLKPSVVATDTFELAVANALVRLHPDKGLDLHPNGVSKEKIRRTPIRGSVRLSKFANSCHSYDTAKIDKRFDYTTIRYNHRTHPQERKMRTTQRIVLTVTWGCDVVPFSNRFIEDLNKIWELRKYIPDPCNPKTARI